jgi:hypothetical protein
MLSRNGVYDKIYLVVRNIKKFAFLRTGVRRQVSLVFRAELIILTLNNL